MKPNIRSQVNYQFFILPRYYQPQELAGGVTLFGGSADSSKSTGVFGMDFSQPRYQFPAGSFQLDITFTFKKSVFFADSLIICLGTGITSTNSAPYITQVYPSVCLNFHY